MAGTAFSAANWDGYDEQSATNPGGALTDFTLLIDVSTLSATWKSTVQSDAGDIRCTKGDGTTELATDLINWAYNAGAPTGHIRVKWSSTLAASGTQNVRVYAGYTPGTAVVYDAIETYGSDNAYDANWDAYWPLFDVNDRTSNGNNLTNVGADSGATGQVGDCHDFVAANSDYMEGSFGDIAAPLTIMVWVNRDNLTNRMRFAWLQESDNDPDGWLMWGRESNEDLGFAALAATATVDGSVLGGTMSTGWDHCVGVARSATDRQAYIDKTSIGTNATSCTPGTISYITVGANQNQGSHFMDGLLNEIQIHSADRSGDWADLEYDQSSDQSTFWGTWAWTATAGGGANPKGVFGLAIHGPLARSVYA